MRQHLETEIALGGYVAQERAGDAADGFYACAAQLIGAKPSDIALTASAVDAWTKAFYAVDWQAGDNLITAYNEYCSNYVAYLDIHDRYGVEIRVARPSRDEGGVDLAHLDSLIDERTRMISVSHIGSSSGEILDVAAIGKIAWAHDVLYLLDACQSVGHIPVDIREIGCHMLSATSRKFIGGPRGVGLLYVADHVRDRFGPLVMTNQAASWVAADRVEWRTDARMYEAWERSVMLQIGFKTAIDTILSRGISATSARILDRAARLRSGLYGLPCVTRCCPDGASAAIITFQHSRHSPAAFKTLMDDQGVGVQVASAAHTRLDLEARGIDSAIRVSPHVYTSDADIDRFLNFADSV